MTSSFRPSSLIMPALLGAMGTITVASAQSASPFAKKNSRQAWESAPPPVPSVSSGPSTPSIPSSPSVPPNPLPAQVRSAPNPLETYEYRAPSQRLNQAPTAPQTPDWNTLKPAQAPTPLAASGQSPKDASIYYPGRKNGGAITPKSHNIGTYESSSRSGSRSNIQNNGQSVYSARQPQVQYHQDNRGAGTNYSQPANGTPDGSQWGQPSQNQFNQGQQPYYAQQGPSQYTQYQNGQYQDASPSADKTAKRGWKDRLGLNKFKTIFRGSATVGAAAGAQYDRFRRGFGQRLPDCPPTEAGCSSALIDAAQTGLRGHTSQFFSDGEDDARAEEVQLETAYLFLRSAYGDVTLGRDDGSAYLFSLGAPSLLKVGASNSPVDYTGFDSVKTVNDASGFAEKVTYTSPRLLGDTVGVGVQFGASYAPNPNGCGVDYCVRSNTDQGSGTVAADLKNVVEVGVALDRKFANGLKVEATGTYARADERSGFAGLDDFNAYNVGLELSYDDWVLGGSYLNSNNGLLDGDYEAYDVGLTWKPSKLGFTLGYGHATDDNVNLTSDQAVFGVTYDFDKITIGGGVQYIDRETSVFDGINVTSQSQDATAIFIETGFKF